MSGRIEKHQHQAGALPSYHRFCPIGVLINLSTGTGNASDWFKNVPWFNMPPSMAGQLIMEPTRPPLRLLGGSSSTAAKPSKLAALAAARKKKENEQKSGQLPDAPTAPPKQSGSALSLLDRLGAKTTQSPTSAQNDIVEPLSTRSTNETPELRKAYPIRKRKSSSPPPPIERKPSEVSQPTEPQESQVHQELRTEPTVFAETMCGNSGHRLDRAKTTGFSHNMLATLYGQDLAELDANPFAGPSPDDVVTQAQAKGSTRS